MIQLQHTLKINTLYLAWQPPLGKTRYCVGTIFRKESGDAIFSYNLGTKDFELAKADGFVGFPSFRLDQKEHVKNVIESFMKRLPSRSRGDFKKYLTNHGIPESFDGDNISLLAHTGAKLPSDGFALIPDILESPIPFDYIMEVAGTRHNATIDEVNQLQVGNDVFFKLEPDNEFDKNAIGVYCNEIKIGYVNKLLCRSIGRLLQEKNVSAVISRKSGTSDRPLIYALVRVR
tara:strand:- start:10343 stop:11038 length:696 start_codon:yes stop_codon:yes gene_type:complete